jgi:hypothetical protein
MTYFPFCSHVGIHCQQNLSDRVRSIDILTGEIAVEVTGVVGWLIGIRSESGLLVF